MIRHYFFSAIRNFQNKKLYFFINLVGLSVSLSICIIMLLFVRHESGFDRFHENSVEIFKLQQVSYLSDQYKEKRHFWGEELTDIRKTDIISKDLPFFLKERIPEIETFSRIGLHNTFILLDGKYHEQQWHFADNSFFEMFSFPTLSTDQTNLLETPGSLVLSKETALRLFGTIDVVGKQITASSTHGPLVPETDPLSFSDFRVSAVVDVPKNSSIQFDFLASYSSIKNYKEPASEMQLILYNGMRNLTFYQINKEANPAEVGGKVNDLLRDAYARSIDFSRQQRNLSEENPVYQFRLVNLEEVHFDDNAQTGANLIVRSKLYLLIVAAIAFLIMIIVCTNCISLTLSTIGLRSKELGVRKVIGARYTELVRQFYVEGAVLLLIAMVAGVTLFQLLIPVFNDLLNSSIDLSSDWRYAVVFGLALFLFMSLLIGVLPVLFLSKINFVEKLKNLGTYKVKSSVIKWVIGFQLTMALFLFAVLSGMKGQLDFLMLRNSGFDKENVILIRQAGGKSSVLKSEILSLPGVESASFGSSSLYADDMFSIYWSPEGETSDRQDVFINNVDSDFMKTLKVELDSGRFFRKGAEEASSVLVNQQFYQLLKSQPSFNGKFKDKTIIGVVKDFNFQPLTFTVSPQVLWYSGVGTQNFERSGNAYIRLSAGTDQGKTVKSIREIWDEVYPNREFKVDFLDDRIAESYGDFDKMRQVIQYSSMMALFLSCMGVFGLMGILTMNRVKEIGIRKVLGAPIFGIYKLLCRDFVWIILIAAALVYYPSQRIIENWMSNFAYQNEAFPTQFLMALGVVFIISACVANYHILRLSRLNPVKFLRHD